MKTIGVPDELHAKLKKYCDKNGMNLGEFIGTSLKYFEKSGINPSEHESPAAEMLKLIKRIDSVVAFIRKQEADLLRPMVESVSLSESRIQRELDGISKTGQVEKLHAGLVRLVADMNEAHEEQTKKVVQLVNRHAEQNKLAMTLVATLIDAKNQTGFMGDLGKTYTKLLLNKPV